LLTWLLLTYKLPSDPSARRVYTWRKLRRLGAILVGEAIWVLPDTSRTHEQFQWLAAEIQEMGGEAFFWNAQAELAGQEESLARQFADQVVEAYQAILDKLAQPDCDLVSLAQEFRQAQLGDYFRSGLGLQVRQALMQAREDER
jgi:hypothetical protein